jgi:diamine N-acetyltransferase
MEKITLREITEDTVTAICNLGVTEDQTKMVASNAVSIAQAHFAGSRAWFRAVYAEDVPVGFVMVEEDFEKPEYFLWRLMIDQRHQGKGYGRAAMAEVIQHVRGLPNATVLCTSCVRIPGGPGEFYEKVGFVFTGEWDEDEEIMRLEL